MGGGDFFGGSSSSNEMSRNIAFAHHPFTVGDQQPPMVVQNPLVHPMVELNPMRIRYLFKKELKNSDVSQSRRIVIPKRSAETHFPFLYDKRGLFMNMEDMDGMGSWSFRFRFWPNNHSRMYILENTGEFVKAHGLNVGDYILLYKDDETGKYVIEARKEEVPRSVRMVINTPHPTEQVEVVVDDDEAGYRFANSFPVVDVDDYATIFDDFTATFDEFPDAFAGEGGAPPENEDEDKPSFDEDPKDFDQDEFP